VEVFLVVGLTFTGRWCIVLVMEFSLSAIAPTDENLAEGYLLNIDAIETILWDELKHLNGPFGSNGCTYLYNYFDTGVLVLPIRYFHGPKAWLAELATNLNRIQYELLIFDPYVAARTEAMVNKIVSFALSARKI